MTVNGAGRVSFAEEQGFEHRLSPRTKAKFNLIQQAVQTGEAQLKEDSQGRIQIAYANERAIPLGHVDESKAHTIQEEKDDNDIDVFLERIDAIKQSPAPSVFFNVPTKVGNVDLDQYEEGQQFTCTKEVLGEGSSGKIVVAKDKETGTEHALKKMKISDFNSNEVRSLVDLDNSDHFPNLFAVSLDYKVLLHMEKLEHGVTLDDMVSNLRQNAPELIRPFSLWMFHDVLSAVGEMHGKGWAHRDLHERNVMLIKNTMKWKVLDFGEAQPLGEESNFNHDALKKDILDAICLFCRVYIRKDFLDYSNLEDKIKAGVLKKELETAPFSLNEEDTEKLRKLIEKIYELTVNPKLEGYGSTSAIIKCIENRLFPDKMRDVMRQAMEKFFTDFNRADRDINLRKGEEEAVDEESDDIDQEATGKAIPDDLLGLFNHL